MLSGGKRQRRKDGESRGPSRAFGVMYSERPLPCTIVRLDVAVSVLRSELSDWIGRARDGEEVVVTDRGTPVARLVAVDSAPLLEQLTRDGVIAAPRRAVRPKATAERRVKARRPVSELVGELRR
ncbi:MAG: type II toxin-antitoxin system Phd/YefM family antitoxin [Dermatophilaceae bacterium]